MENAEAKGERKHSVKRNFTASGKSYSFYGFRRAYVEGSDNPLQVLAERGVCHHLKAWHCQSHFHQADGHRTKPLLD